MASNALSPLSPDGAQSRERTPERGEKSERVKRLLGRMAATEAHEQTGRTEKEHNLDKRLSAMLEAALPALLKSRTPRRSPRLVFPKSPVKKAEASPPNLPTLSPPLMSNHATTSPTRPSDTPRGSFTRDPLHPQPPAPARPTQRSPLSPSRLPSSAARPAPTSGDAERLGASAPVARLLPLGSGAARGTGGSEGSRADMKERALGAPSPKSAVW
ncbi:hypothetical protein T484DRAFT_1822220 [Baffinella frigidus]|nr:hypothetical protein T484DRAFT_1822220 [Cryptophyta sp. CCMP2293]